MRFIYVVGAHCTGKTTLVEAVSAWLQDNMPQISITNIKETARGVLQLHQFTRDDVRSGGERCLRLQKLISHSQFEMERACQNVDLVISDRSGIDPLVYARMYCGEDAVCEMLASEEWAELGSRMRKGTVIVCEPVQGWLFDDGIRLMPENMEEWVETHELFCETLNHQQIPHVVLPASTICLNARIQFFLAVAGILSNDHKEVG